MHEPPENMQDEPESMPEAEGYAGSSFSVPVELAAQYKYEPYSPPEAILGSRQFDEDLQRVIDRSDAQMAAALDEEKAAELDLWIASSRNVADPSSPPPHSATFEKIAEATKDLPPERQARITRFAYGPRPNQAMAIALSLAAEFPGMFAGPDILGPVRMPLPPLDVERYRPKPPPIVIDSVPPLEKRRTASFVPLGQRGGRMGKPAGSKLARKAAKGML